MSDANEFFNDLKHRLFEISPQEKDKIEKAIVQIRNEWKGAQIYVSSQQLSNNELEKARQQIESFYIEICQKYGISYRTLMRRLNTGGRPKKNFQHELEGG
jgi:hypothetical protein